MRVNQLTDTIVFQNSTYYFSVKENEPRETNVGVVKALTGSQLVQVTYRLMSNTDLFGVDKTGAITTLKSLDKEKKEMYFVNVEATDSRTPPNSAITTVFFTDSTPNTKPKQNLVISRLQFLLTCAPTGGNSGRRRERGSRL